MSISWCRWSLNKNGALERVGGAVRLKMNKEKEEEVKVKCHLKLKRRYLSRMVLGYRKGLSWLAGQVSCLIRNIPDWMREGPELAWGGEWRPEGRARAHCVCTTGAANRWLATNLEQRTLKGLRLFALRGLHFRSIATSVLVLSTVQGYDPGPTNVWR